MEPFEENYTAWVDGLLPPTEAAAFEAGLGPRRAEAEREREAWRATSELLRRHAAAPPMPNAEFFRHALLRQIEVTPSAVPAGERRVPFWRLFWASAACAGVAVLVSLSLLGPGAGGSAPQFQAQILEARPGDPAISAIPVRRGNLTVLWLDGLEYLPAEGRP